MDNDFPVPIKFQIIEQLKKKPNRFHDIERHAILKSIAVFANRNPQPQPRQCSLVGVGVDRFALKSTRPVSPPGPHALSSVRFIVQTVI